MTVMNVSRILNKTILTDIDGVVLDWSASFFKWMGQKGHLMASEDYGSDYGLHNLFRMTEDKILGLIDEFNRSAHIGFLSPMPNAVYYIRLLRERGYKFVGITSLGGDCYSQRLRTINLVQEFPNCFEDMIYLPLRGNKTEALAAKKEEFGPNVHTIWIDDHITNAFAGEKLGFKTIVYSHTHNIGWDGLRLNSWAEIYEHVLDLEAKYN